MNVLFMTLGFFKSIDAHGIYTDLLRTFVNNNHHVYVVCQNERRNRQPTDLIKTHGCDLLRVKTGNIQKTNILEKGISTLFIEYQFKKAIIKYFKGVKFDLILYSTPPVTFSNVIDYFKRRDHAKTYCLLKDIFPQNSVDLGILSPKGILYRYFKMKETGLYRLSDTIGCMSQANVDYILKHNPKVDRSKVEVCPNCIEVRDFNMTESDICIIREKYGIPRDKTVFVYGGNLGKPQGIPFLMDCLKALAHNEEIFFIITGSGTEYGKLERYISEDRPAHVILLPMLPKDEFDLLVASSDIGMIFLDVRFTIPNFPSRLLTYMQAGLPVIAATDRCTDVGETVVQGGFGLWSESNDVNAFKANVSRLCDPVLRKQMGIHALLCLKDRYTADRAYQTIMRHRPEKRGIGE